MKKIVIFFALFLGIFYLTSHFAQAETITQTIPLEIKDDSQKTLFDGFWQNLKDVFYPQVLAETTSKTLNGLFSCGRTSNWVTCSHFYTLVTNQACKITKRGDVIDKFEFKVTQDEIIYIPKPGYYDCDNWKWKINKATLTTTSWPEGSDDDDQCLMRVNIIKSLETQVALTTPTEKYCTNFAGVPGSTKVETDFNDLTQPSGAVNVIVDLHGKGGDPVGPWEGKLILEGTRPSAKVFQATAKNYATGQTETVGANKTLEICKGESVTLKWAAEHSSDAVVFIGSPQRVYKTLSDTQVFTPVVNTNVYFAFSGYGGEDYKEFFFEEPIDITLHDCGGEPAPWVQISANPDTINKGETSTLTWNSGNTTYCRAVGNSSDWSGDKPKKGTAVVTPSSTRWYDIKCFDAKGTEVRDNAKVTVTGGSVGNIDVKIRLNGAEVSTPTDVSYEINGPVSISGLEAPQTFEATTGTYNVKYISGGPDDSIFANYSPGQSVVVAQGGTTTVYLEFSDGATGRCNITVQALKANCDGTNPVAWTGPLSYALLGPIILNGTAIDQTFENVPAGRYYLTELVGGPGNYNGVDPGNPVSCISGATVNMMMKFNDCGTTYSKCNYATGVCSLCPAYSEECKYTSLTSCNQACAGCADEHKPKADVFCWANYDSDECIGMNDNNPNTPPVILYDKTSDPCGDIKDCFWEIFNSSGKLVKTSNNCGSYPWYDETPGVYTAKLRVTDSKGDSSTDTQKFTIKNVDALTCNFAWDPDAPTVGGKISFFDQSLTPNGTTLTAWGWTFQDASPASSTAQTVSDVIFNTAGVKSVTIKVKNSAGATCTLTKEITVKTMNPSWKETIPF